MMRLAGSHNSDDVDRDTAVRLLAERAVLTRTLCRELLDVSKGFASRRPCVALSLLLGWVQQHLPQSVRVEPHPADGLDAMVVPDGCRDLFEEIRDGAQVGEAFFMLLTADTSSQARGDEAVIRDRLTAYWAAHPSPAYAPSVIECWSGFPTNSA